MRLVQRPYRGTVAWFVEWVIPATGITGPFLVGRVSKLPTVEMAMRIVNAWKIVVYRGVPHYWTERGLVAFPLAH